MESQKVMREEQTAGRGTLATPSSWWVERLRIERPRPEDQEPLQRNQESSSNHGLPCWRRIPARRGNCFRVRLILRNTGNSTIPLSNKRSDYPDKRVI